MPTFTVTGPDGRTATIDGPRAPTESDLKQIFAGLPAASAPAAAPTPAPTPSVAPGPVASAASALGAQPGGAIARGAAGVDETAFPSGHVTDPIAALAHAVTSPLEMTALAIHSGQKRFEQGFRQVREGNTQRASPDKLSPVGNMIAGLVPVAGPIAADITEKGFSGDVAGAVGNLLGIVGGNEAVGAATGAARAKLGEIAGAVKPPPGPTNGATLGSTDPALIPYTGPATRGEQTGSQARAVLERVPESSPFTGKWWRPFRSEQQAALKTMGDKIVDSIRGGAAGNEGTLVDRLGVAISKAKYEATANVSKLYGAIDQATQGTPQQVTKTVQVPSSIVGSDGQPLMVPTSQTSTQMVGGVRPSTAPLKAFAQKTIAELESRPSSAEHGRVLAILNDVANLPDDVSFQDMHGARSDWSAVTRGKDAIPAQSVGIVKKLTKMADDSMRSAAVASGKPDVVSALDAASAAHAENIYTFNRSIVSKIAKAAVERKDPEALSALIQQKSTSAQDIAALKNTVPASLLGETRAAMVGDMLEKAWAPNKAVPAAGEAAPGAPVASSGAGKVLSGDVLSKSLDALRRDSKASALFEPEQLNNLGNIAKVAATVTPKASAMMRLLMMNSGIVASIANPAMAAGVAKTAGGMMIWSKIITERPGAAAATGFLRAADKAVKMGAATGQIVLTPELRMWSQRLWQLKQEQERKGVGGNGGGQAAPPATTTAP